jgi:hypothetical protein
VLNGVEPNGTLGKRKRTADDAGLEDEENRLAKKLAPSFNGDGNNADPILLDEDTGAIMIDD